MLLSFFYTAGLKGVGVNNTGILTFISRKNSILSMKFFMLINVKMPTIVGILTFMSRKNSILGLSESEKCSVS